MSTQYVSDCDYCGKITMVVNDPWGGTCCGDCMKNIESKMEGGESKPANRHDCDAGEYDYDEDLWRNA